MFSRHSRIIPQSSNDASHILNYANQRPLLRKPEVCNHHLHIDSYWLRVAQAAHTIIRLRSGSTHANKTQRCSTEKSRTGRLEHVQPEILSEENGPRNMTLLMKADAGRGRAELFATKARGARDALKLFARIVVGWMVRSQTCQADANKVGSAEFIETVPRVR